MQLIYYDKSFGYIYAFYFLVLPMKRILFGVFCTFVFGSKVYCQNLYDNFYFNMPLSEAKQVLKSESQKLKNISFGPMTSYAFRKKSLVDHDGKLVSINVWSKKNLTLLEAETYLIKSRKHFESNKYKTVYAQENWSKPVLVKKNLPCIRFVDSDKTVVVEVDPRGQGGVYNVFVTFYDYKWFLKKAQGK
ncbi:MAG: hypothetical protein VW080_00575 [Flavobacteriaceae bacterium]